MRACVFAAAAAVTDEMEFGLGWGCGSKGIEGN